MLKKVLVGAVAVLTAVSLAGCSGGGTTDTKGGGETEFVIATGSQPPSLDPLASTSSSTREIVQAFLEPLITLDANQTVQPVLASAFEQADDNKSVHFTLRENVKFHDGTTVTADDAAASLQDWVKRSGIGIQFFTGAKVEADSDTELTMTFKEAVGPALILIADQNQLPMIRPAKAVESAGKAGIDSYIGTGPYAVDDVKTDQYIKLKKFDGYVSPEGESSVNAGAKKPVLDRITYEIVPDVSTQISGLQTGQYDASAEIPPDNYDTLSGQKSLRLDAVYSAFDAVVFNKKKGLMADPAMRHAVLAAIDVDDLQAAAFGDQKFWDTFGGVMPEASPYYYDDDLSYRQKPDETVVKQKLQEAGYNGETVRILASREYEYLYNQSVVLKDQLDKAGFKTELVVSDWATLAERNMDPDAYEMFVTGFVYDSTPLTQLFLNSSWSGFTDSPEITKVLDKITSGESTDEQALGKELQEAVNEYLPVAMIGGYSGMKVINADYCGESFAPMPGPIYYNVQPCAK